MSTNGSEGSDDGRNERRIRDMLGLVKFCLETTAKEDAGAGPTVERMDPDRQAWLQQAISSMTVDTTRTLLENLAIVKGTIANLETGPERPKESEFEKTCKALEILTDLCEEIDYAADFAKLDGFSIFKPLIGSSHEDTIVQTCGLIAALAQNNPLCQTIALNTRLFENLLDFVDIKDNHSHIKARSYALYAISSILRSNPDVRTQFENHLEGISVLINLLRLKQPSESDESTSNSAAPQEISTDQSSEITSDNKKSHIYWWRKLMIRTVFLFRTLCYESPNASKLFFERDAIRLISAQLENPLDAELCEHLLQALKAFLISLDPFKQNESLKLSPNLRDIVKQVYESSLQETSDDYDLTDTKSTCKELLGMIDSFETKK